MEIPGRDYVVRVEFGEFASADAEGGSGDGVVGFQGCGGDGEAEVGFGVEFWNGFAVDVLAGREDGGEEGFGTVGVVSREKLGVDHEAEFGGEVLKSEGCCFVKILELGDEVGMAVIGADGLAPVCDESRDCGPVLEEDLELLRRTVGILKASCCRHRSHGHE